MRIIGGEWRSRVLPFPDRPGLRPTPNRVRETLFNWLGQDLEGLACLDLFAGSGALGFEALSRHAASVTLVERDMAACAALRDNAAKLQAVRANVVCADAYSFLAGSAGRYDVIFLDPPFDSGRALECLEALPRVLNPGARVYLESGERVDAEGWETIRVNRAGAVFYHLLRRT